MNARILMLLLPLAPSACSPANKEPVPAAPGTPPAAPAGEAAAPAADGTLLAGHVWKLESAADAQGKRTDALFPGPEHVLTLSFADGNAAVSGGCNRLSGRYEIDAQSRLKVGGLRATLMACDPPLMQADQAITELLSQPLQARVEEGPPPQLHLVSAAGDASRWAGEPTAETRFGGPGERVFLEVAPQRVPCSHPLEAGRQCLQVREVKYDADGIRQEPPGEWRPLLEEIEGFEFRPGERKVLRLKKFERDPAPADASPIVYVLDMVIESELTEAGEDG